MKISHIEKKESDLSTTVCAVKVAHFGNTAIEFLIAAFLVHKTS